MQTQTTNSRNTMLWVVGIAIILFCGVGIAAIMGWIPTSMAGGSSSVAATPTPKAAVATTAAKTHTAPVQVASNTPARSVCVDCGVVESTRDMSENGKTTGIGGISGAVVGGVLGHQVGGGRGKDLATVAGVVGGALAGNAIEKRVGATSSYEVTVRLENGSSRVFTETNPTWRTGDRVRIVDGMIRSRG